MNTLTLYRKASAQTGNNPLQTDSNLLQHEAFEKLFLLIEEQLRTVEGFAPLAENAFSYHRSHQAILIEGGRGSGKTTFLLNALKALNGNNGDNKKEDNFPEALQKHVTETSKNVHVLPIIDPTLIETKEHIIIVIIAMIDKVLDECFYPEKAHNDEYEEVDKARREMAEGLALLDGIGKTTPYGEESWEDPLWVMSNGLRKAKKGTSFEKVFQKYIRGALKILNREAFVLAFDDVDTNFQHGRIILETIRKYLTTPQLVLLVSGDLDLYGRLVRSNIYMTLGAEVMKHDTSIMVEQSTEPPHTTGTSTQLSRAIRELEEQYLLKIIPPQNRITMLPLNSLRQNRKAGEENEIYIKGTYNSPKSDGHNVANNISVSRWVSQEVNRLLLSRNIYTLHPFFDIISREHLRLVIDYLYALNNKNDTTARRAVQAVFEARLRHAGIDALHLAHTTAEEGHSIIFRWLAKQDDPARLSLFGVPNDSNKAIVLHCLALTLAQNTSESAYDTLRTLLTVCLPLQMMQRSPYTHPSVRTAMADFLWSDTNISLFEIAARIGSIARLGKGSPDQKNSYIGTMKASRFGSIGVSRSPNRRTALGLMFGFELNESKKQKATLRDIKLGDFEEKYSSEQSTINLFKADSYPSRKWIQDILEQKPNFYRRTIAHNTAWFTIDNLIERTGPFGKILNLICYKRYASDGAQHDSISALSLFSAVIELLADHPDDDLIDNILEKRASLGIVPAFIPDSQDSSASIFIQTIEEENETEDNPDNDPDDGDNEPNETTDGNDRNERSYNEFITAIKKWRKTSRSYLELSDKPTSHETKMATWPRFHVSPAMLGQVANRIHDQLSSLDDEVPMRWQTGLILHRQITNILHALVTVTSNEQHRMESPKTSDEALVQALVKTYPRVTPKPDLQWSEDILHQKPFNHSLHPLAAAVLSCPLIWAFLSNTSLPNKERARLSLRDAAQWAFVYFRLLANQELGKMISSSPYFTDFDTFSNSPAIHVTIGRKTSPDTKHHFIKQEGFFTLLNVVPRYYHNSN